MNRPTDSGHEFPDLRPSVDRRPVPDHQPPVPHRMTQVEQELDYMHPVEQSRTHHRGDLTSESDRPHDRKVIPGLPLVQDGRLTLGRLGLDDPGQEVQPRFVHENRLPSLAPRPASELGPDLRAPVLDGALVPLDRLDDRDLGVHSNRLSRRGTWLLLYRTPNSWAMTPAIRAEVQTSPRKP